MKYIKTFENFSPGTELSPELEEIKSQFPEIFSKINETLQTQDSEKLVSDLMQMKSKFGLTDDDLKDPATIISKLSKNQEFMNSLEGSLPVTENIFGRFADWIKTKGRNLFMRIMPWATGIASVASLVLGITVGSAESGPFVKWCREATGVGEFDRGTQAIMFAVGFIGIISSLIYGLYVSNKLEDEARQQGFGGGF